MAGKTSETATGRKSGMRRPGLNREKVLEAAMEFADANGLSQLSMRKLAARLGVEAMSLYNHVSNKEDLLDGLIDKVAEEFYQPRTENDWRAEMQARAVRAHEVLLTHPWASLPIVSRINTGEAMLAYVDATVGCLAKAGFSYSQADHVWNLMDSYIYGFTLQELQFPFQTDNYAEDARTYLPAIPVEKLPHLHALTTLVAEGKHNGLHDFKFGLDLILDGLDRLRCRQA